jgi:hypothetical protein
VWEPPSDTNVWISQFSSEWLFDHLPKVIPPTTHAAAPIVRPSLPKLYEPLTLLLRGWVTQDGRAVMEPALPGLDTATLSEFGAYCLHLEDSRGETLVTHCFELPVWDDFEPMDPAPFLEAVPRSSALARVTLWRGDIQVAEQVVSPHAPTVQILSPQPNANWYGTQTLRWQGADADGDPLSYLVQYSADDRLSWTALAVDLTRPELSIDTNNLAGGTGIWLRVVAGDGLNLGSATVGPLAIPKKSPELDITAPETGAIFMEGMPVTLQANGWDAEDGGLPGHIFEWRSDRDGILGTDDSLTLKTLSVGTHHITVSAADSDGNVGTATIDVVVNPFCAGDCSSDRAVTVDELITLINIALGNASVFDCQVGDTSEDGQITIDEILAGVNTALNGCP